MLPEPGVLNSSKLMENKNKDNIWARLQVTLMLQLLHLLLQ